MQKLHKLKFVSEVLDANSTKFDREQGVIRDVVMFAPPKKGAYYVSEAGNHYSEGFHEKAISALEGAPSWENHGVERRVTDARGRFRNVRLEAVNERKRVLGDFYIAKRFREEVMEAIEEFGDTVGFSIQAYTVGRFNDEGTFVNEGFADHKRKPSCDLVDCSSATINVFESVPLTIEENQPNTKENRQMEITNTDQLRESFPALVKSVEEAAVEAVKTELKPKLEQLETQQAELATLKRESLIVNLCAKHKLAAESLTEVFRKTLKTVEEAEVELLIEDRAKAITVKGAPVSGNGKDRTEEGLVEPDNAKSKELNADQVVELLTK